MISAADSIASGSCHVQKYHGFVFLVFNTLQQKNEEPLLFTLLGKVIINNNVDIDSYSDRWRVRVTVMPQCLLGG